MLVPGTAGGMGVLAWHRVRTDVQGADVAAAAGAVAFEFHLVIGDLVEGDGEV